jgi:ubiquinone/menaquinone biosynthesis C-methylase UbiE
MSHDATVLPDKILGQSFAFAPGQVIISAVELNVFEAVHQGRHTAEALAEHLAADPRGLRILLNALVALELLEKVGERYGCAPVAESYLVPGAPAYLGDSILHNKAVREAWSHLTEVVKTGRPRRSPERAQDPGRHLGHLVKGLYLRNYQTARELARRMGAGSTLKGLRILDLGAGSGAWSIPFAEADATARVVAVDLAPVIPVTREYAVRHGVAEQYQFRAGNVRELDFGSAEHDLAILGHLCHSEGPRHTPSLLKKVGQALKPGGQVVIADMIPNDERTGPVHPLLFAVNMLVNTEEGDTFTLAEYRAWLRDAGFGEPRELMTERDSPILAATKN